MHVSLGPGAQKLFRHNWGKLHTLLFYFFALNIVVSLCGKSLFFHLWNKCWVEVFSYCTFTGTFATGFQKGFDHERVDSGVSCWHMRHFVVVISARFEICSDYSCVILFRRHSVFSIFSLRSILVCSLNATVFFQPWDFLISFGEPEECNASLFALFVRVCL